MEKKVKMSKKDTVFMGLVYLFLTFVLVIVLYPLIYVISASFSSPGAVSSGKVFLLPVDPTLIGYDAVFKNPKIVSGFLNSFFYLIIGTAVNVAMTMLAAYPLSRREFLGRKIISGIFVFTMYFGGGLIPFYMVMKTLHLTNTRTLMVLISAVSVYNIIVTRSFMENTIPEELRDAAKVDGCGDGYFFFRIVMPLSKAIMAVLVLFLAVSYWNSYFNPMIFLTDRSKYPLALYLREILLTTSTNASTSRELDPAAAMKLQTMAQVIKYGVIVGSTLPIICVYPFLQKYFVKGVMIGSVKG